MTSYLIWSRAKDQQVEGDRCHHVYKEPAFKVMDRYLGWMADHLFVLVHVGGPEVYEDVNDEHDVHHQVHDVERAAGISAFTPLLLLLVVEKERSGVGREDGRVDDQQQDQPVPHSFEGAVVEDGELVDAVGLEFVLGQHVGSEGQDLEQGNEEG